MNFKSPSSAACYLLLGSSLGINGILSLERMLDRPGFLAAIPVSSPVVLGFGLLLLLLFMGLYLSPLRYWIFAAAILVPIEVSTPIAFFPKLSPIDYFAALSAVALLLRFGIISLVPRIRQCFPSWSWMFFSAFLAYGIIFAYVLDGSPRTTLRWGEFFYFYCLAALAAQEGDVSETRWILSNLLAAVGAVISIIAIGQFAGSAGHAAEAHATFGHRNVMAAFLSLSLPAASAVMSHQDMPWTSVRKTASFLMLCAFIMSYSRGAWMGLTVGVLFVLWKLRTNTTAGIPNIKNALLIILMLIGPIGALLILRNPERGIFSSSQRPRYWQAAYSVLSHKPLTGLGPGNYERDLPKYLSPLSLQIFEGDLNGKRRIDFWQHLHNLYLQIAVEFGLVGFVLWGIGILLLMQRAYTRALDDPLSLKPYFLMSLIAFFVHNTVDLMTISSLDILVAFFLALTIQPVISQHPTD